MVIGDDWVPRLSLLAMENVRDAVVACLVEASLAGETEFATWWRALSDAWGWTICRSKYAAVEAVAVAAAEVATADKEEEKTHHSLETAAARLDDLLTHPLFAEHGAARPNSRGGKPTLPMYPLGRILYLWPRERATCCHGTRTCIDLGCVDHTMSYGDVLGVLPFHSRGGVAAGAGCCGVAWPTFSARLVSRAEFCNATLVLSTVMHDDHMINKMTHVLSSPHHCTAVASF